MTSDRGRVVAWPAPRRAHNRRWLAPAAAALAAMLLWVLWPVPTTPLPNYLLSIESGNRATRTTAVEAGKSLDVKFGDRFEIILRPALAVEQPVAAQVYVERLGELTPVSLASEVSDTGSIRLLGVVDTQLADADASLPSLVDLWIVVAADGSFPDLGDVERRLDDQAPDLPWHLIRCQLQVTLPGET